MKKSIVCILMLMMASYASAAMMSFDVAAMDGVSIDGPLNTNTEYELRLMLSADAGEDVSSFNTSVLFNGVADFQFGVINEKFQNIFWSTGLSIFPPPDGDYFVYDTRGETQPEGPYGVDGDILATWFFTTGDTVTMVSIDDYSGPGLSGPPVPYSSKVNGVSVDIASLVLPVVPEPMTVSLLGLGGMALLRRRK